MAVGWRLLGLLLVVTAAGAETTAVWNGEGAGSGLPLLRWEDVPDDPLSKAMVRPFRDRLKDGSLGPEMVAIPGGCFQMGSPESEKGRDNNERSHQVCVKDFKLGKFEVTNKEFRRFRQGHDSKDFGGHGLNGDDQPAVYVNWEDASAYAQWLSMRTGKRYRLPTEEEWEYAARAGTRTARYWGEDPDDACRYANVLDRTAKSEWSNSVQIHSCEDGYKVTAPVGRFQPNAWGLYDMLGNVSEWTRSAYDCLSVGSKGLCRVVDPANSFREIRGGSWATVVSWVRSASRYRYATSDRDDDLGFRLARD